MTKGEVASLVMAGIGLTAAFALLVISQPPSFNPKSLYYSHADSTTTLITPTGVKEIVWFDTIPTVCYDSGDEKGWIQVRPVSAMLFSIPDPLFLDDEGCKHE